MRVRVKALAAGIATAFVLTASRPAAAEGLPKPEDPAAFLAAERFFAESKVLGDAWARALSAALEVMKETVERERQAAEKVLASPLPPRREPPVWQLAIPPLVQRSSPLLIRPAPMLIEPVVTANAPLGGDRAVLLGIVMELADPEP